MNRHGHKLKQLAIPMELYERILRRCGEEQDTNETRVMLRLIESGLTTPPEIIKNLPDIEPLFPDDDGDRDLPEIIRLRKIFPDNEPEVQKQLKEIGQGFRELGQTEEEIHTILYGPEKKDE